jgi:hypothetical protein
MLNQVLSEELFLDPEERLLLKAFMDASRRVSLAVTEIDQLHEDLTNAANELMEYICNKR